MAIGTDASFELDEEEECEGVEFEIDSLMVTAKMKIDNKKEEATYEFVGGTVAFETFLDFSGDGEKDLYLVIDGDLLAEELASFEELESFEDDDLEADDEDDEEAEIEKKKAKEEKKAKEKEAEEKKEAPVEKKEPGGHGGH